MRFRPFTTTTLLTLLTKPALICTIPRTPEMPFSTFLSPPLATCPVLRINLLLDFDSTLTTRDTISSLASISSSNTPWSYFVDAYLADVNTLLPPPPTLAPGGEGRGEHNYTTVKQEMEFLERYLPIERRSVERIERGKYFSGLERGGIKECGRRRVVGGQVAVRDGWGGLWMWLRGRKSWKRNAGGGSVSVRTAVVSVNWSKEWIRGVLEGEWALWRERVGVERDLFQQVVGEEQEWGGLDELEVYSNEFVVDPETGITTGAFSRRKGGRRGLWTAQDKVEVMDEVLAEWDTERDIQGGSGAKVLTIYVGDSPTDLGCLLKADVGLVVGGGRELAETCGRLGLKVEEGLEGARWGEEDGNEWDKGDGRGKRLYRVKDFREVLRWLEGFVGEGSKIE